MLDAIAPVDDRLSLTGRAWQLADVAEAQVARYAQHYGLPDIVARLLVIRQVEEVEAFLTPRLKTALPDPLHLLDMDVAAQRVAAAVISGETIAIFGDYDVDGATSSALLMRYLRALGAVPMVYIPDRMKEGYGPNAEAFRALQEKGATLVITVDCGTMAFEPLEAAHAAGLDVIVVDHHIGAAQRPKALAIVNPNRLDEASPHGQLAAVGVAFLLAIAVNTQLRSRGFFAKKTEPDVRSLLDIVALGTVCDMVPLTGVNRALVAQGLKVMAARHNLGIRTLLDQAAVSEAPGVYACGFVLGPRINAGGRVGKSDLGVRLLTTEDTAEALGLARELEQLNAERRAIEAMVLEEALALAEKMDPQAPVVVVAGDRWHPGVIGIVAGRLKERLGKPVAVVALHEGIGKASARSVAGFDFGAAVIAAREAGLLVAGGGHAMAAGFTVLEGKLPALNAFLAERWAATGAMAEVRALRLDGVLSLGGATPELVSQLEKLGPFGQGNPPIRIALHEVVNLRPEVVGEHHVKTLFIDPISNARLSAISFRCLGTPLGDALLSTRGQKIDVAGQLRLQEWNGKPTVSFMIEDLRLSRA